MEKHNHHTANSRVRLRHVCALCVCVFAALALVTITGCRDTDALREIIIDQNSDVIDYNNEQKFYINDSTAEEESDLVSSLEVSDEDPESDIIQNLIIYSSEPNSEGFTAKHSAFSATPDFTGIEASDTVFFYYSDALDAFPHALTPVPDVEEENDEQDEEEVIVIPYATTLANGNTASTGAAGGTAGLQETTSAESASEGTTGEDSTDDAEDETPGDDAGDAGTPEDESTDQGGGLGEEVIQPDDSHPGEQFPTENATINTVKSPDEWSNTTNAAFNRDEDYDQYDCVAAFGEYAKIVQMVGGDGALAATDAETLSTLQSWGVSVSADVGWDYASGAVLNADGTWAIDVEAIVASGAQAILLGTTFESYTYSMSDDQLNYLEENNVALVPSENLYTSVNIKTNVNAVGYMLQGSSLAEYGSQAESRASEYCDFHDSMVNVNGGLAQDDDYYVSYRSSSELQNTTNTLGNSDNATTHTVLISYWDNTARMSLSGFDFGPGAAYATAGYSTTPVSFYMQAGGTINTAASRTGLNATGMVPVLQFTGEDGSKNESSWYDTQLAGNINYNNGNGYHALLDSGVDGGGSTALGKGFGSDSFPKIIVTSSYYKDAIVENSASESSLYHPWKFTGSGISSMALGVPNSILWTSIGSNLESGTVDDPNPVYPEGYIYPEDILVNPSGICDWTQGTVESFLETGFVAAYINGESTGYSREDWHADVTSFYEWAWGITPNISSIDTNGAECVN